MDEDIAAQHLSGSVGSNVTKFRVPYTRLTIFFYCFQEVLLGFKEDGVIDLTFSDSDSECGYTSEEPCSE